LATLAGPIGAAAAEGTFERPTWLEVTVAEDDYLADLPARIEALTTGWPVEVLRIRRQRGNASVQLAAAALETLDELSPHEVFARRLQQEELSDELKLALQQRYRGIVTALQEEAP
jgi:exonuclease SbcD